MTLSRDGKTYIAGKLTADDWRAFKASLVVGGGSTLWATAFEDYFRQRLHLRYLRPIELLQSNGTWEGEGFSIVSIQCALIEFLAATRKGENYRHLKRGETLGPHEYNRSGDLFRKFLTTVKPFDTWFTEGAAADFYASVRCALLHEARTKNGWRIWVTGSVPVDTAKKTVFRDTLQRTILDYVESYGKALLTDQPLQEAFVRKFDNLAK
ncbi:hypothetical protein [Ochrobactrum sp. 3-3]|uniref:hypothetical protein n=1 Tax=Ochrobactrum sp. 3-3 TaxID=1830124 RepID=UPI000DEFD98B|nr:hypothetical protein [Ochrobactrum sp. 3-3]